MAISEQLMIGKWNYYRNYSRIGGVQLKVRGELVPLCSLWALWLLKFLK